jgi:hypothetical protein
MAECRRRRQRSADGDQDDRLPIGGVHRVIGWFPLNICAALMTVQLVPVQVW